MVQQGSLFERKKGEKISRDARKILEDLTKEQERIQNLPPGRRMSPSLDNEKFYYYLMCKDALSGTFLTSEEKKKCEDLCRFFYSQFYENSQGETKDRGSMQ